MNIIMKYFITTLLLSLTLGITPANAGKPDPVGAADCSYFDENAPASCADQLIDLCAAIEANTSLKTRDEEGLIGKTIGAGIKINQDKFNDATTKLDQIGSKVSSLADATKPKISEDDADLISSKQTDAELCVDGL